MSEGGETKGTVDLGGDVRVIVHPDLVDQAGRDHDAAAASRRSKQRESVVQSARTANRAVVQAPTPFSFASSPRASARSRARPVVPATTGTPASRIVRTFASTASGMVNSI